MLVFTHLCNLHGKLQYLLNYPIYNSTASAKQGEVKGNQKIKKLLQKSQIRNPLLMSDWLYYEVFSRNRCTDRFKEKTYTVMPKKKLVSTVKSLYLQTLSYTMIQFTRCYINTASIIKYAAIVGKISTHAFK